MKTQKNEDKRPRIVTAAFLLAAGGLVILGGDETLHGAGNRSLSRVPKDFVEPRPVLETKWTPATRSARSLAALEYVAVNTSGSTLAFTATLLWDGGTSEGHTAVVDHFEVPAGQEMLRRVDPARIPEAARGERYPGLLQISLTSGKGDTAVLPAFYVMPLRRDTFPAAAGWGYELMDAADLEAATGFSQAGDQEDGVVERVVEWRPTMVKAIDPDGGR